MQWRSEKLNEFISLIDQAIIAQETAKKKRTEARKFQEIRGVYVEKEILPEDQLPPFNFPRILIGTEFLDCLSEITIESLNFSDSPVDINRMCLDLKKKLGKAGIMDTS